MKKGGNKKFELEYQIEDAIEIEVDDKVKDTLFSKISQIVEKEF